MLPSADYIVPVEIESQTHNVYVIKRPGVDHFLTEMGKIYEVVVFTASLSKVSDQCFSPRYDLSVLTDCPSRLLNRANGSMPIPYWTCLTRLVLSSIGYLGRAAIITKAITSRWVSFGSNLSSYQTPSGHSPNAHPLWPRNVAYKVSHRNCGVTYTQDLSQLGRTMETSIIIDNSPASYIFHPNNAVPVSTWFNDPHDTELTDLCPFLTDLAGVEDVRGVLDGSL